MTINRDDIEDRTREYRMHPTIKLHHLRVEALRKGLHSAYSLIFDKYCTKSMRDELRKDY